jgi:hypothetical protein
MGEYSCSTPHPRPGTRDLEVARRGPEVDLAPDRHAERAGAPHLGKALPLELRRQRVAGEEGGDHCRLRDRRRQDHPPGLLRRLRRLSLLDSYGHNLFTFVEEILCVGDQRAVRSGCGPGRDPGRPAQTRDARAVPGRPLAARCAPKIRGGRPRSPASPRVATPSRTYASRLRAWRCLPS